MKGNYWQTGGVEVAFSFGLFGRFPISYPESSGFLVSGWAPVETLGVPARVRNP